MQVNEMRQFLASNVIVDIPIVAEMFSHRFGRKIDPGLLNAWRQQGTRYKCSFGALVVERKGVAFEKLKHYNELVSLFNG